MKIAEVLLLEAYFDELELAIKDRLAQYLGSDVNEIPTEEFRKSLSLDGFLLSFEELKSALEQMDVVNAIDKDSITPKGKIPNDMAEPEDAGPEDEEETGTDVAAMAQDQGLDAVKEPGLV